MDQPQEGIPFCLRRPILLAASLLCILIIVALEIAKYFVTASQCLPIVSRDLHYLWTYGPTLVLSLVATYWSQIEFKTKQVIPWILFQQGHDREALEIDYFSFIYPRALLTSLKYRHYLVSLGLTGSGIFRLLILVSTALFAVQTRTTTSNERFIVQRQFNFSSTLPCSFEDAAVVTWATRRYNLPYPSGSTPQYVVQEFRRESSVSNHSGAILAAEVDVFRADLVDCEEFTWSESSFDDIYFNVTFTSKSHQLKTLMQLTRELYRGGIVTGQENIYLGRPTTTNLIPIWFPEIDRKGNQTYVMGFYGIICSRHFEFSRRTVWNDNTTGDGRSQLRVSDVESQKLPLDLPYQNISSRIFKGIGPDSGIMNKRIYNPYPSNSSAWITLLNATAPQRSLADFKNSTLLIQASRAVFQAIGAQAARECFMSPVTGNTTVLGTVTEQETRLCIRELSLRLIESLLALLVLTTAGVAYFGCPPNLPNPSNPLTYALMLSQQPNVEISNSSTVLAISDAMNGTKHPKKEWWHPMTIKRTFIISISLVLLCSMVVLEILYQKSKKGKGIARVSTENYDKYVWTYIPALITMIIGGAFAMVDQTARILHPFQILATGKTAVNRLGFHTFERLTIIAMPAAIKRRAWGLFAIMLTTLLAPTLTIIVSGLYTPVLVPFAQDTTASIQGWFDLNNDTKTTAEDSALLELTQARNLTYPSGVFHEFAFPKFDTPHLEVPSGTKNSTLMQIRIPAIRGQLNCSLDNYFQNISIDLSSVSTPLSGWKIPPPQGCEPINKTIYFSTELYYYELPNSVGLFGMLINPVAVNAKNFTRIPGSAVCGDGKLHLWMATGHVKGLYASEVSVVHCVPYLEMLHVDATFNLKDSTHSSVNPPIPDESSVRFLNDTVSAVAMPNLPKTLYGGSLFKEFGNVDYFFQIMLKRKGITTLQEVVGRENISHLIQLANGLYQEQIALSIHTNFRSPVPPSNTSEFLAPLQAKLIYGDKFRLQQTRLSTRLLEAVLGLMAICGILCAFSATPRKILYEDPGSIAAKLRLFAGSRLVQEIREATEKEATVTELREWKRLYLRLGWWEATAKKRFGIDIEMRETEIQRQNNASSQGPEEPLLHPDSNSLL